MKLRLALLGLTLTACGSTIPEAPPAPDLRVEGAFHQEAEWRFRDEVKVAPSDTVQAPVLLTRTKAQYAEEPRKRRLQGDVGLELEVDENGMVARAEVTQPLDPALDANAIVAATKWRYSPARLNGVPRASLVKATVSYRIQ
ncbi:MAG TPA: energy transducer TonB [Thermoanaerobaculia bacterium]